MEQCESCQGFVPAKAHACPHCNAAPPAPRDRRGTVFGAAALASLSLVTLMACYGAPECIDPKDDDKDGASACPGEPTISEDCDDKDPTRRPGFPDPEGDGIDQNCDGVDGLVEVVSARRAKAAQALSGPVASGQPTTSASAATSAATPSASTAR